MKEEVERAKYSELIICPFSAFDEPESQSREEAKPLGPGSLVSDMCLHRGPIFFYKTVLRKHAR